MPRRPKSPPPLDTAAETVRFPQLGGSAPVQTSAVEDRQDMELDEIIEQIGSDSKIVVYHVIDGKGQPTYAGPMPVENFTLENVLEVYGGGDKSLVVFQSGKKVGTWRVSLDPSVPPTSPRAKLAERARSGVAAGGGSSELLDRMMLMQAQNADMMQKTMIGIMGAVTTMLTAQRPQSSDLDTVVKVAEVMRGNQQSAPATELMTMFKEGIALAARLGGDGDDGTMGVIGKGLEVVGKIVENAQRPGLPAAPVPRSLPAPRVADSRETNPGSAARMPDEPQPLPEQTAVSDRPWIASIRPYAPLLFGMVGVFGPATAAQAIADRLDENAFEDLINDIESGAPSEFVQRLGASFGFDPATLPENQRVWLIALVDEIQKLVEPGDIEPANAEGE